MAVMSLPNAIASFSSDSVTRGISVHVEPRFDPRRSQPENSQWFFLYTVKIHNRGSEAVQLLTRHWIITDADGEVEEVRGEGVVGEQPVIAPGESFRYSSGANLATPVGCMEGSYFMVVREPLEIDPYDLPTFEVPIPAFSLHTPTALH